MKAMHKDRGYRPPSIKYRIEKTIQRNKAAIVTATLISLALILGTVISSWQAIRATHASREAQVERDRAVGAEGIAQTERQNALMAAARAQRAANSGCPNCGPARRQTETQDRSQKASWSPG